MPPRVADRVILIGLEPFGRPPAPAVSPRRPSIADVVANVLDGLPVDRLATDLHRLAAFSEQETIEEFRAHRQH
jgi:hypothetical protein